MEIIKDTFIREKYHSGFSRKRTLSKVSEVVIHGTGGGYTLEWMRGGGRAEQYYKGIALFHYLIDRAGVIWEIIDPDRWVYHSSRGRMDRRSIGIELENYSRTNEWDYSDFQYDSLLWLVFNHLRPLYPDLNVIMSHKRAWQKVSGGKYTKECPGPAFDWDKIEKFMHSKSLTFDHDPRYESYWNIRDITPAIMDS